MFKMSPVVRRAGTGARPYTRSSKAQFMPPSSISLTDWAADFGPAPVSSLPFSGSVGSTRRLVKFTDRYMNPTWNTLSGYDASEGALFILFHAVLAGHPGDPRLFAVDNADHSLNPRLARALFQNICDWYLGAPRLRQSRHELSSLPG